MLRYSLSSDFAPRTGSRGTSDLSRQGVVHGHPEYQAWPQGRRVSSPAVLAEARRGNARIQPQLRHSDGLPSSSTRAHACTSTVTGVLLMHVRPSNEPAFDLVFTPDELENVFGEVRDPRNGR